MCCTQPLHLAEEDMQHLEREVDHLSLALNGNAQGSGTDGSGEDETEENEEESRARNPYWNVREPGGDEVGAVVVGSVLSDFCALICWN